MSGLTLAGLDIDQGIRHMILKMRLPGEAQQIDRLSDIYNFGLLPFMLYGYGLNVMALSFIPKITLFLSSLFSCCHILTM